MYNRKRILLKFDIWNTYVVFFFFNFSNSKLVYYEFRTSHLEYKWLSHQRLVKLEFMAWDKKYSKLNFTVMNDINWLKIQEEIYRKPTEMSIKQHLWKRILFDNVVVFFFCFYCSRQRILLPLYCRSTKKNLHLFLCLPLGLILYIYWNIMYYCKCIFWKFENVCYVCNRCQRSKLFFSWKWIILLLGFF